MTSAFHFPIMPSLPAGLIIGFCTLYGEVKNHFKYQLLRLMLLCNTFQSTVTSPGKLGGIELKPYNSLLIIVTPVISVCLLSKHKLFAVN